MGSGLLGWSVANRRHLLCMDAPAELFVLSKATVWMELGLPHLNQPSIRKWQNQVLKDAQSS